ncbi:MAG: hypothetical protein ACK42C_07425 [Aquificaceae bacterium]|jgi:hypothetical protein|uniref:hypothetical protein n=1 Tax=Hydrogenobacter sp. Uz 6-8 TaxID=3384828 RepID=UPI000F297D0A|nr:MAG: hypothetical protein D6804_00610 [Aquificota bacterium]
MDREEFLKAFSWDGEESYEELLIRAMLYGNPLKIAQLFTEEELKKVFLENIHRFKRENRAFWQLVLEVSEDELRRCAERNFREGCILFPY